MQRSTFFICHFIELLRIHCSLKCKEIAFLSLSSNRPTPMVQSFHIYSSSFPYLWDILSTTMKRLKVPFGNINRNIPRKLFNFKG